MSEEEMVTAPAQCPDKIEPDELRLLVQKRGVALDFYRRALRELVRAESLVARATDQQNERPGLTRIVIGLAEVGHAVRDPGNPDTIPADLLEAVRRAVDLEFWEYLARRTGLVRQTDSLPGSRSENVEEFTEASARVMLDSFIRDMPGSILPEDTGRRTA